MVEWWAIGFVRELYVVVYGRSKFTGPTTEPVTTDAMGMAQNWMSTAMLNHWCELGQYIPFGLFVLFIKFKFFIQLSYLRHICPISNGFFYLSRTIHLLYLSGLSYFRYFSGLFQIPKTTLGQIFWGPKLFKPVEGRISGTPHTSGFKSWFPL